MAMAGFVRDRAALKQRGLSTVMWGLALGAFGVAVLIRPELTAGVLIAMIGVTVTLVGLSLMYGAFRLRDVAGGAWLLALIPATTVALFGAFVWLFPSAVGAVVLGLVAVMLILSGAGDVMSSFALASVFSWWWLRLLRGVLIAGAGVWLLASDLSGLAAIGTVIGVWALFVAAITVTFGVLSMRDPR